MLVYCARIYIAGAKLADVQRHFPNARKVGGRIYVGYDNATGNVFTKAESVAREVGGYVETDAD